MNSALIEKRSSILISYPIICFNVAGCLISALYDRGLLSCIFLLLALLALIARLWANGAAGRVFTSLSCPRTGLYPGETLTVTVSARNEKALPVMWLNIYAPLPADLCIVCEQTRRTSEAERTELTEAGANERLVGEMKLGSLLWYSSISHESEWTARKRGRYSLSAWRLNTGDGFGLCEVLVPFPEAEGKRIDVFPARCPVRTGPFLRNMWNSQTGRHGYTEDVTLIRSTRDYQPGDPARSINWRLSARGLPLTANVYEQLLPRGIHFLLDSESFFDRAAHPEEFEEALSILGSELSSLSEQGVSVGLSLCRSRDMEAANLFDVDALQLLHLLSGVFPTEKEKENGKEPERTAVFFDEEIAAAGNVGRFFYVAYDAPAYFRSGLGRLLDSAAVTVLASAGPYALPEITVLPLSGLRTGAVEGAGGGKDGGQPASPGDAAKGGPGDV